MTSFLELGLSSELTEGLSQAFDIHEPTQCQEEAIPILLKGDSLVLQAMTGSGKTLAYLAPLLQQMDPNLSDPQLLIIAPTNELAMQVVQVTRDLNQTLRNPFRIVALSGSGNIRYQLEALKKSPQLLIGTPGRVEDLFKRRKINAQTLRALVLDEVDALLGNDGGKAMEDLCKNLLRDTPTIVVSASISEAARQWLATQLPEAKRLESKDAVILNPNIRHFLLRCEARQKFDWLRRLLSATEGSQSLIFMNRPEDIDQLLTRLHHHSYPGVGLYADMSKAERQKTMRDLRLGLEPILVASDLGARGLDVPGIDQVIHLDFPPSPLAYVHRAGRTGRADQAGASVAFVAPEEEAILRIYARDLGVTFEEIHLTHGEVHLGPAPQKPTTKRTKPKRKTPRKKGGK